MRIAQETETVLILKDDASKGFIIGTLLTLVGLGTFALSAFSYIKYGPTSTSPLVALGVGGFFLIFGLVLLLTAKIRTTVFDTSKNSMQNSSSGFLGKHMTTMKISDLARLELRAQFSSGGKGGPQEDYRIALVAKDGTELFLDALHAQKQSLTAMAINYSGKGGMGREREIGQKVGNFLGIPFLDGNTMNAAPVLGDMSL